LSVALLKAQPQAPATTPAVWAPASSAPAGLLTPVEAKHHDQFIERAKAGQIDIVFFGSTPAEMWLWPDRGRSVWDQTFGSLKAAGFGSGGTHFESLLWRMQHGELDGYQAKLVVVHAENAFFAGQGIRFDGNVRDIDLNNYVSKYAAIIAEIRARQPQARILLFSVFPRSKEGAEPVMLNAALAALGNNDTVFFIDMSKRFFRADGSFDDGMWSGGVREPAFKAWAEELQPWLDRFVR
jgi:hypothetical protein